MGMTIGIDLGTTNSVAAVRKVDTEVLKNAEGELITPSCVTVKKGLPKGFVVGRNALEWSKQDPENTITAVKRLMGRKFGDPEVQDMVRLRKLHYVVKEHGKGSSGSVAVVLDGKEYAPQEISAEILAKVKRDAEQALGAAVDSAVITVPSYFNDKQKHATRVAAAIAGLKLRRLLPEPTAAAISFGVEGLKGDDALNLVVFDFGGGTFDLSVLTISGGQYIEQGKGGDMWLGGDDIDNLLADHVLRQAAAANGVDDMRQLIDAQDAKRRNLFNGELKAAVEKAKIALSSESEAFVEILGVLKDKRGKPLDVEVEISRKEFEAMLAPMLERTVALTKQLIQDVGFTAELVDRILLVGGSSLIPAFPAALREEFGAAKVLVHARPLLAVAEGAAILSHRLAESYECPGCAATVPQDAPTCPKCGSDLLGHMAEHGLVDIVHATAHDYYIHLADGKKHLFVEKNTPLPCEAKEVFSLVDRNQKLAHLRFSNTVNGREEIIGELWLGFEEFPADKRGVGSDNFKVEVDMHIDANNLIEVDAHIQEMPEVKVTRTLSRGGGDEKLFRQIETTIDEINKDYSDAISIQEGMLRLVSVVQDANALLDKDTEAEDEAVLQRAGRKLGKLSRLLEGERQSSGLRYFVEDAMENYPELFKPELRQEALALLESLRDADENADYEDNAKAIDALDDFIDKRLGGVGDLHELEFAARFYEGMEPAKAVKFWKAHGDILAACKEEDEDKAKKLQERYDELIGEAAGTRHMAMTMMGRSITKDITR